MDKSSPHLAQAELCPLQGFGAPWPRVRGRRGEAVRLLSATDSGRTRGEMQGQAPLTTQPAKWAVAASACQGPTGQSPTQGSSNTQVSMTTWSPVSTGALRWGSWAQNSVDMGVSSARTVHSLGRGARAGAGQSATYPWGTSARTGGTA